VVEDFLDLGEQFGAAVLDELMITEKTDSILHQQRKDEQENFGDWLSA
jgi:hypothetical protein